LSTASISKYLQVLNVRITFRNAPVHLLEKFAFKNQKAACELFRQQADLDECVILQTCNRVEVFGAGGAGGTINEQKILKTWASEVGMSNEELVKVAEVSTGKEVVSHLLRLAAGLDSLVVGEDQILGQMKRAFDFSRVNHIAGPDLSMVFDKAFKVGSRVRANTGVNKGSVSIGSMAVNLAEENLDTLNDKNILLIGSGEGASLVAKALRQRSIKFQVTSRTFDRAKSFAATVAGNPVTFDNALESLRDVDLIFVSTTAPYFLITNERIESAMKDREKGMMILDLSNPRTVEESVAGIRKIKLVNLDQISEIVEKNIRFRRKEIMSAERIIESEMKSVDIMLKRKKIEPLVVSIFKSVGTIRKRELSKTLSILGNDINPMERRVIEQLSHSLVEGMLTAPINNLRREIDIDGKDQEELLRLLAKLFKYEQN
jgi:glutamyl-tRNA reductase